VSVGTNASVVVWSDNIGYYDINDLLPGVYNASAWRTGYEFIWKYVNITYDIYSGDTDFYLPPALVFSDSYRILLTWGGSPSDLDSYTFTPWDCRSYYGNHQCLNGTTLTELDRDDTSGYGPETTTWSNMTISGRYEFWVNRYSSGVPFTPVGEERASVDIYSTGNGIIDTVPIPYTSDITLNWWNVFRLDACPSGHTITINNVTADAAPLDFPWSDDIAVLCAGGSGSSSDATSIVASLFALLVAGIMAF
jgi:hypothetical protein